MRLMQRPLQNGEGPVSIYQRECLQRGVVGEETDTRRKLFVGYAKRGRFTNISYTHPVVRHPWFVVLHDVDVTVLVTPTCQNGDRANQQEDGMSKVIVG